MIDELDFLAKGAALPVELLLLRSNWVTG